MVSVLVITVAPFQGRHKARVLVLPENSIQPFLTQCKICYILDRLVGGAGGLSFIFLNVTIAQRKRKATDGSNLQSMAPFPDPTKRKPRPLRRASTGLLGGPRGHSGRLSFHLVLFPTAQFLAGEKSSMVTLVAWIMANEPRFVNFLSYPSLSCFNCRSTVGTFV
jgi:hypothetical protein